MEDLKLLKKYLDISIKKNGNQPLTVQHLSNLINIIIKENESNFMFDESDATESDIY